MKRLLAMCIGLALCSTMRPSYAQEMTLDIKYAEDHERQVLDIYSPKDAKNLPVLFWVHGGGWQVGDKANVHLKPQAFTKRGFVFVATNYRLLPDVDMGTIIRDVAKSVGWVHKYIADHGGDPKRMILMGHSAGAQLVALLCTDDRYLQAEAVPLTHIKGCIPSDGDTYDVPAIIELAEVRCRVHGLPQATFGHRQKFGNDAAKHHEYSSVTHVANDKNIPPFLVLYVGAHPDTRAQAKRLGNELKAKSIPTKLFGARDTNHTRLNENIGKADDPATKEVFDFVDEVFSR